MAQSSDYLEPLGPDNAAVRFIDNQTTLTLGVPSIDLTVLKSSIEGWPRSRGCSICPSC